MMGLSFQYFRLKLFSIILLLIFATHSYAQCENVRRWQADAATTAWNTANNWNPADIPNAANETALIVSDWFFPDFPNANLTVGCVEIQSGLLTVTRNRTLTIVRDYFKSLNTNALQITNNRFTIAMAGTAAQEFHVEDDIPRLTLNNATTIDIRGSFAITDVFTVTAGTGNINLYNTVSITPAFTIPAGATFTIKSGATLKALGGITVNGILKIEAGANLEIGNATTLNIATGALFQMTGASGNIASLTANNSGRFTLTLAGSINANYFSIGRTQAQGLNLTGTIQLLDNGDFEQILTDGYAMTWGAAATVPATLNNIGFFDQGATGTQRNINATNFNVSAVTINSWSGIGGTLNETDPNNRLTWGDEAPPTLKMTNRTAAGSPPATIITGSADTLFMTIGFSMTALAPIATDITSIKFTLAGSNNAADINNMKVYLDTNSNCIYDVGVDTLIDAPLVVSGSPASTTLSIPAGDLSVIDSTDQCIHIFMATNSSAQNGNTIAASIAGTADVVNSESYAWATSGAPPIQGATSTITGDATIYWQGGNGDPAAGGNYAQANNWSPNTIPATTNDCQIGPGYSFPIFQDTTERNCQNATLSSSGRMSWGNLTTVFSVYGSLNIGSTYTFSNAVNGTIAFKGNSNQSIVAATTYPGNVVIENTGAVVSLDSDWTIGGNFTLTSGTFVVTSGRTLTIQGNANINAGIFIISPGATVIMGDTRIFTVAAGATLQIVGSSAQSSTMTTANTAQSFTVNINGTISARFYSFSRLGTTGVTINSGASINATNYLQNGAFSYPVNNNTTLLRLFRQIPGNALTNMTFESSGSAATTITNISTDAAAGDLQIDDFNGDLAGEDFDNDPVYLVNWGTQTNTLNVTAEATSSGTVNQGETYVFGRFGFRQTQAGVFANTDITQLTLQLLGTATSSDISAVRIYNDSTCTSSGGTLLGTGTFSGSPAQVTFSALTGVTVASSETAPPLRCIYVEMTIASLATADSTVNVKIHAASHVVNSEAYEINPSFSPPVGLGAVRTILGTTTSWNGSISTDWNTAGNWNGGLPTAGMNCIVNAAANNPIINGITANCRSLTIGNGTLTMSGGATLNLYGGFENTGTFNQAGQIFRMMDNGVNATDQTISSTSAIESLVFDKTAGGTVQVLSTTLTISNLLNITAGNNFNFTIPNNKTLTLSQGATLGAGTFTVQGGGKALIANGQTFTVSGGNLVLNGVLEAQPGANLEDSYYSLFASNKAILRSVSGTFSFTSTSGSVHLNGFVIDGLDNNGFRVGGTTSLLKLDGGQFAGMPTDYANVKVLQLNSTGSLPLSANKVGFNWETSGANEANTPANTESYQLVSSTGCGSQTIDFTEWYGDWYEETPTFNVSTKISTTNCNVNFGGSSSAVSLVAFEANPYNQKVELLWSTLFEQEHTGFNVYRSDSLGENFIKINPSVIRNIHSPISYKGNYRFVDSDVQNGQTYYYYLQDVDIYGQGELHGPKLATPLAVYGEPPVIDDGVNDGGTTQPGDNTPGDPPATPIQNPSFRDLGSGVQILSQTSTHLRIRITPPEVTYAQSPWDQTFEKVLMSSYGHTEQEGHPELLKRQILIEINPFITSLEVMNEEVTTSSEGLKTIQPAPTYILNASQTLEAHYILNQDAYNLNQSLPENFISLDPTPLSIGQKKFLSLNILPLSYNAFSKDLTRLDQAIIDIALDGAQWDIEPPVDGTYYTAGIIPNTLRIDYRQRGMLQLLFEDLVATNTQAPFIGASLDELRLYQGLQEIPIWIEDQNHNGFFDHGDSLIFFANYQNSKHDHKNQVVLSTVSLYPNSGEPKRISLLDATITGSRYEYEREIRQVLVLEENNDVLLYERLGDGYDHFIWKVLRSFNGFDTLTIPFQLPIINTESYEDVVVTVDLKGQELGFGDTEYEHHVGLFINDDHTPVAEFFFTTKNMHQQVANLSHDVFHAGLNTLTIKVLGNDALSLNQIDRVAIDKVSISYMAHKSAYLSDKIEFENHNPNTIITINDFSTAQIDLWDLSDLNEPSLLINTVVTAQENSPLYSLQFQSNDDFGMKAAKYFSLTTDQYLQPSALSLSVGYQLPLKSHLNRADYIVIGEKFLIDGAQELLKMRQERGLTTKAVTLDQIYAEFSSGVVSAKAIRDFIQYARSSWAHPKPRYLLILGDGSYDLKEHLDGSTKQLGDIPMVLEGARFIDFATDNYFVAQANSHIPEISVGRIPTNNVMALQNYIQKVIDYENAQRKPTSGLKHLSFIAGEERDDNDPFEDQFEKRIAELTGLNSKFVTDTLKWHELGGNVATREAIVQRFEQNTPYMMTYMGHGAPNLWGSLSFMKNTDMDNLSNLELPIVMALNCDNALFYEAERVETSRTIGEALILNPNGGAIAFIGSSTQTTPAAQIYFAKAFHSRLNHKLSRQYSSATIGEILLEAKVSLGNDPYSRDILKSTMLFGDPALKIPRELYAKTSNVAAPQTAGGGCTMRKPNSDPNQTLFGLLEMILLGIIYRVAHGLSRRQRL